MNKQLLLSLLAVWPIFVAAQSWSSCSSDLDGLRRRASDASSIASSVDSAHQRYKSAQDDLRNCLQFPQVHDLLRNGCSNKRSDYTSATSDYKSQLSNLKSGFDDMNRKIKASKDSCSVDLAQIDESLVPTVSGSNPSIAQCAIFQGFKGQYPIATIMTVCGQQMSESACRVCLSK